eukprot:TRINITY_DN29741_c0_g1_i1.p1 TRINITY_DN29741_c0_g1~~TRINITY_DN29741_c0_g1_i1.p1  ORF type:complete len:602 (+),score=108.92 TRINITY_DN29741_c0_g1_i1:69-1874(+)
MNHGITPAPAARDSRSRWNRIQNTRREWRALEQLHDAVQEQFTDFEVKITGIELGFTLNSLRSQMAAFGDVGRVQFMNFKSTKQAVVVFSAREEAVAAVQHIENTDSLGWHAVCRFPHDPAELVPSTYDNEDILPADADYDSECDRRAYRDSEYSRWDRNDRGYSRDRDWNDDHDHGRDRDRNSGYGREFRDRDRDYDCNGDRTRYRDSRDRDAYRQGSWERDAPRNSRRRHADTHPPEGDAYEPVAYNGSTSPSAGIVAHPEDDPHQAAGTAPEDAPLDRKAVISSILRRKPAKAKGVAPSLTMTATFADVPEPEAEPKAMPFLGKAPAHTPEVMREMSTRAFRDWLHPHIILVYGKDGDGAGLCDAPQSSLPPPCIAPPLHTENSAIDDMYTKLDLVKQHFTDGDLKKWDSYANRTLTVRGLGEESTGLWLLTVCRDKGAKNVVMCAVLPDRAGSCMLGSVTFETFDDAEEAAEILNGAVVSGLSFSVQSLDLYEDQVRVVNERRESGQQVVVPYIWRPPRPVTMIPLKLPPSFVDQGKICCHCGADRPLPPSLRRASKKCWRCQNMLIQPNAPPPTHRHAGYAFNEGRHSGSAAPGYY